MVVQFYPPCIVFSVFVFILCLIGLTERYSSCLLHFFSELWFLCPYPFIWINHSINIEGLDQHRFAGCAWCVFAPGRVAQWPGCSVLSKCWAELFIKGCWRDAHDIWVCNFAEDKLSCAVFSSYCHKFHSRSFILFFTCFSLLGYLIICVVGSYAGDIPIGQY